MPKLSYTAAEFGRSPMIVFYETTRACNLKCIHCRADAQRVRHPDELDTAQARRLIDQLTEFPTPPLLVLTGGDPIKREDLFELIAYARVRGLSVAMTPSATPLVTTEVVERLKQSGLHRLAVSLDAADARTHDAFRQVPGSFARTLRIIADARHFDLPVQINTTIARHNVDQIDAMADLLAGLDIVLWSVFFLVPTGRAQADQRITPVEYEEVFESLWRHTAKQRYGIKTTEAPHFRRFMLEKSRQSPRASVQQTPYVGTNDGRGVMFVSHVGEIYPSGFLPIRCGRFPNDSIVRVYQQSIVFRALRDSDALEGKCGVCDYRQLCGGSRARAYALTGDPLAAEPDCLYIPPEWSVRNSTNAALLESM